MKFRPILSIYALLLILGGCTSAQRGLRVRKLADDVRPVFQVSQMDSETEPAGLSPELTELAEQVAEDPENLQSKRRLADAYLAEQHYIQAFRLYEDLRSQGVDDAALQFALAQIWHSWNDQTLARLNAENAIARDENMTAAWELLGRIHLRENNLDEALKAWESASRLEPGNAILLSNIGYSLLLSGNWASSRMYLERAVDIDASLAEAQNNLGIVLARIGEVEAALQHFMTVSAPAAAYNNLGVVYLAQGHRTEAIQQFMHAVELDPAYEIGRKNLALTDDDVPVPQIVELGRVRAPLPASPAVPHRRGTVRPARLAKSLPTPIVPLVRETAGEAGRGSLATTVTAQRTDTHIYWMALFVSGFGLAAARELSRACQPGRQDWNCIRRLVPIVIISGVLEVIATRLL